MPHDPATPWAEQRARSLLHTYGIRTERYTAIGLDHPMMPMLTAAFEATRREALAEAAGIVRAASDPDSGSAPTLEDVAAEIERAAQPEETTNGR